MVDEVERGCVSVSCVCVCIDVSVYSFPVVFKLQVQCQCFHGPWNDELFVSASSLWASPISHLSHLSLATASPCFKQSLCRMTSNRQLRRHMQRLFVLLHMLSLVWAVTLCSACLSRPLRLPLSSPYPIPNAPCLASSVSSPS